jgi:hypothetical protein
MGHGLRQGACKTQRGVGGFIIVAIVGLIKNTLAKK